MLVVEGIDSPILCLDWLRRHKVIWAFRDDSVLFKGMRLPVIYSASGGPETSAIGVTDITDRLQKRSTEHQGSQLPQLARTMSWGSNESAGRTEGELNLTSDQAQNTMAGASVI